MRRGDRMEGGCSAAAVAAGGAGPEDAGRPGRGQSRRRGRGKAAGQGDDDGSCGDGGHQMRAGATRLNGGRRGSVMGVRAGSARSSHRTAGDARPRAG